MKFIYSLFVFLLIALVEGHRHKFMKMKARMSTSESNNYEKIVHGIFEILKIDKAMYKNCTPTEWIKNNSTDIPDSLPKLKNSFDFLKKNIARSLEAPELTKQCGSPEGILAVQDFLKKNLLGGKPPKEAKSETTNVNVANKSPLGGNGTPPVPQAQPSAPKDSPAVKKAVFMELQYILQSSNSQSIKPFDTILKPAGAFLQNLKNILNTPLVDRVRYVIIAIRYQLKIKKGDENTQLMITNFIANMYKLLDKGLEQFIERIVAIYCDKDRTFSKAITEFKRFNNLKEQDKKFLSLGKFFGYLVISLSK